MKEAITTQRICNCGTAPLLTPKNYELLTVGKVKRGSSLSENLSITMGNWSDMIPYHCFMLQLILSSTPHYISIPHGLSNLETTLGNLTPGGAASL